MITKNSKRGLRNKWLLPLLISAALYVLAAASGCSLRPPPELEVSGAGQKNAPGLVKLSDDQLMALVRLVASGSDQRADEALNSLQTYPKETLVTRLERVRGEMSNEDRGRVAIAFVSCLLNHDYENNKSVIVKELRRQPHSANLDADWEAELIQRLIARGDSHLLPVQFETAEWADGAMAEGLSGYLTHNMKNRPDDFLVELTPQTSERRQRVYGLLVRYEPTTEELDSMMRYLESVPRRSPTFDVAREMLGALRKI